MTSMQEPSLVNSGSLERSSTSVRAVNQPGADGKASAAIELQNLEVKYGEHLAVNGLSLTVPVGAIFGFLGPNGAGKTTTIKTILGLRKPDGGRVRVLGYDAVTQSLEVRARVGYMSEINSLYDFLTVPQHCAFCRSVSKQWDQGMVDRYVSLFGLPTNRKVGKFSRGMKSQLALSLLMGSNPDLLILDEPTAGLDPVARHEFLNQLVAEIAVQGKTIFFSSHLLSEVEAVADRVGIIRNGKLIVCDELDHLKQTRKVLKLTYVELPPAAEVTALRGLPGVMSLEQEGRCVRLLTHGDVEALLQMIRVRSQVLRDMDIVDLNLEDIFLTYMKEESNGR